MEHSRAWWQERSRVFLSECARLIESRIGGETIEAIFLCGSFAAGEETVVLESNPVILLSDVDLVVIVKTLQDLFAWSPRRAELGERCEALMPGVRFAGRVDVGVMLAEDLKRLPARPGVYEMRARGRVLSGNARILDLIPRYAPSDITTREALILVENRAVSLIDSRPGKLREEDAERYGYWYRIARVYTDIAAASLSIAGAYVSGYAAREDLIRAEVARDTEGILAKLVPPEMLRAIERWTRFKLEPSIETALVRPEPHAFKDLWKDAAGHILFFWRQAASLALEPRRDIARPLPVSALAGRAPNWRDWRNHARGWREYFARIPASRRVVLAAALGRRLVSQSPLDAARQESMKLLEHRLTLGADTPVRGAKGGFPYHGGDWEYAAAELCSVWNALVFGRADG